MKKLPHTYLIFILYLLNIHRIFACGPFYDIDNDYYNLFSQEIIDDKQYEPFLLTFSAGFNHTDKSEIKNENIEEWQEYFGISYENALYLVFEVSENTLTGILSGEKTTDPQLNFITPSFIKKYRKALEYLVYAKYLEPYMHIIVEDSWYYSPPVTVKDLDYEEVVTTLINRWNKIRDKELKLRYGYQLVRFAHYNRKYEEAIFFFDRYVEVLNYKPAMYYHALSQKAGAERGNGDISSANYHFLQVFANSKNLKEIAVNSIRISDDVDWAELLYHAKTKKEISDAYLLLGYNIFNNPLNEIEKIIQNDPDAVQAKVLMVRAINLIERKDLDVYRDYSWYAAEKKYQDGDKRFPQMNFLSKDIIDLSDAMTENPAIKDKNFWYMTSSYLHFLNRDFEKAKWYLKKVEDINDKYALQKQNFAFFIEVSELPVITSESEVELYDKYHNLLGSFNKTNLWDGYLAVSTSDFVRDLLANRYFLQKDYAKSFLLNNRISELEENPQLDLLNALEEFYYKPEKNPMEKYIAENYYVDSGFYSGMDNYFDFIRGVIHLTRGGIN